MGRLALPDYQSKLLRHLRRAASLSMASSSARTKATTSTPACRHQAWPGGCGSHRPSVLRWQGHAALPACETQGSTHEARDGVRGYPGSRDFQRPNCTGSARPKSTDWKVSSPSAVICRTAQGDVLIGRRSRQPPGAPPMLTVASGSSGGVKRNFISRSTSCRPLEQSRIRRVHCATRRQIDGVSDAGVRCSVCFAHRSARCPHRHSTSDVRGRSVKLSRLLPCGSEHRRRQVAARPVGVLHFLFWLSSRGIGVASATAHAR